MLGLERVLGSARSAILGGALASGIIFPAAAQYDPSMPFQDFFVMSHLPSYIPGKDMQSEICVRAIGDPVLVVRNDIAEDSSYSLSLVFDAGSAVKTTDQGVIKELLSRMPLEVNFNDRSGIFGYQPKHYVFSQNGNGFGSIPPAKSILAVLDRKECYIREPEKPSH